MGCSQKKFTNFSAGLHFLDKISFPFFTQIQISEIEDFFNFFSYFKEELFLKFDFGQLEKKKTFFAHILVMPRKKITSYDASTHLKKNEV